VYRPVRDVQIILGLTGAKSTSGLATSGTSQFARTRTRAPAVTLEAERYTVATQDTLAPRANVAAGVTKGAATLALKHAPSGTAENLQVVPEHELDPRPRPVPGAAPSPGRSP